MAEQQNMSRYHLRSRRDPTLPLELNIIGAEGHTHITSLLPPNRWTYVYLDKGATKQQLKSWIKVCSQAHTRLKCSLVTPTF